MRKINTADGQRTTGDSIQENNEIATKKIKQILLGNGYELVNESPMVFEWFNRKKNIGFALTNEDDYLTGLLYITAEQGFLVYDAEDDDYSEELFVDRKFSMYDYLVAMCDFEKHSPKEWMLGYNGDDPLVLKEQAILLKQEVEALHLHEHMPHTRMY